MNNYHPVYIHLGGDPSKRDEETALVNEAIKIKERTLARPLTSREILETFAEVIEPDASKRLFLSGRQDPIPRKVWTPSWAEKSE